MNRTAALAVARSQRAFGREAGIGNDQNVRIVRLYQFAPARLAGRCGKVEADTPEFAGRPFPPASRVQ